MPTKIEWADESWNPVTGCTKISTGCRNCYAGRMSKRLAGRFGYPAAPHNFDVTLHPDKLNQPLHWKKPRRVFVCSMGDLFHEDVLNEDIFQVLERVRAVQHSTFMILTKRPERMRDYFRYRSTAWRDPFPNLWLGVTVEDQEQANKRVPILRQIPAAVHFASVEPCLDNVEIHEYLPMTERNRRLWQDAGCQSNMEDGRTLDWIICGAETGPGARPMELDWARSLRDQCQEAGVPFFFKKDSDGSRLLDGRTHNEFPNGMNTQVPEVQ